MTQDSVAASFLSTPSCSCCWFIVCIMCLLFHTYFDVCVLLFRFPPAFSNAFFSFPGDLFLNEWILVKEVYLLFYCQVSPYGCSVIAMKRQNYLTILYEEPSRNKILNLFQLTSITRCDLADCSISSGFLTIYLTWEICFVCWMKLMLQLNCPFFFFFYIIQRWGSVCRDKVVAVNVIRWWLMDECFSFLRCPFHYQ